jgi:long-chain acyl-CoA synthetase
VFPSPSAQTALTYKDQVVSYAGLIRRITACSAFLPLRAGERAAIVAENRPEWVYALYAVWQCRGTVVPIDPATPAKDLCVLFKDCTPSLVCATSQTKSCVEKALALAGCQASVIDLDEVQALPPGADALAHPSPYEMDALAALLYTSGTTGDPKGVMLSYRNIETTVRAIRAQRYYEPEDSTLALLPFYHILPLQGGIIIPLSSGCKVSIAASMQKEEIASILKKEEITTFIGVPRLHEMFHAAITERVRANFVGRILFALSRCIGSQKLGHFLFSKVHAQFGPKVRMWVSGGAKADPRVIRELWALGFRMIEGYGLTEAAPIISFNPFKRPRLGSAGQIGLGTEARIVDNEVVVRGANVMQGYYNKPEQTAQVIKDGWLYTGDTGHFDRKGYLHVTGRRDEMIVLPNGKKIDPEAIEKEILALSPLAAEVSVAQANGQLAAVVYPREDILKAGMPSALQAIRENVIEIYNKSAAPHKRILQIYIAAEALPRTRLGKLRRFMLRDFFDATRPQETQSDTAESAIADATLHAICGYLGRKKGIHARPETRLDFDLNLDSLDRLELASFIQSSFGRTVGELDIAQAKSVGDIALLVQNAAASAIDAHPESRDMPRIRTSRRSLIRALVVFVLRHTFRLRKSGLENLPKEPCILAANHESYLDVLCLFATLPKTHLTRTLSWVKASPVMEKVVRFFTRGKNIIVVHSKKPLSTILAVSESVLELGHNLIIFPEGSRTSTGTLAPFRPGFAMIACKMNIPVVPIVIEGAFEAMPRGRIIPRFGKKIHITITPPLTPLPGESEDNLALRTYTRIAEFLAAHKTKGS